jgi:hypothetical protein
MNPPTDGKARNDSLQLDFVTFQGERFRWAEGVVGVVRYLCFLQTASSEDISSGEERVDQAVVHTRENEIMPFGAADYLGK